MIMHNTLGARQSAQSHDEMETTSIEYPMKWERVNDLHSISINL